MGNYSLFQYINNRFRRWLIEDSLYLDTFDTALDSALFSLEIYLRRDPWSLANLDQHTHPRKDLIGDLFVEFLTETSPSYQPSSHTLSPDMQSYPSQADVDMTDTAPQTPEGDIQSSAGDGGTSNRLDSNTEGESWKSAAASDQDTAVSSLSCPLHRKKGNGSCLKMFSTAEEAR